MTKSGHSFETETYDLGFCFLRRVSRNDTLELGPSLASMEPWKTLGYSSEGLSRYLLRQDNALYRFSVYIANSVAGVVGIRHPWLNGPYIELLALRPSARGCGVGRSVVEWVVRETSPSSGNLWATVSEFNHEARSFYNTVGFIEVAPLPHLVKTGFTEILLRRILC